MLVCLQLKEGKKEGNHKKKGKILGIQSRKDRF